MRTIGLGNFFLRSADGQPTDTFMILLRIRAREALSTKYVDSPNPMNKVNMTLE
jgi:hypothetical protein